MVEVAHHSHVFCNCLLGIRSSTPLRSLDYIPVLSIQLAGPGDLAFLLALIEM